MAKNKAKVQITVEQQAAVAAFQQFTSAFNSMTAQAGASVNQVNTPARKTRGIFDAWGGSLKGAIVNMAGATLAVKAIHTVAELARKEFERIERLQKAAADRQAQFLPVVERIRFNLPPEQGVQDAITIDEIRTQAAQTINPTNTALAIEGAISAGLGQDNRQRVEAALTVAEVRKDLAGNADAMRALAEAILTQQSTFGGTATENLAVLQQAQTASRVTDVDKFATNIAAAAANLRDFGFTQRDAFSLLAAVGTTAVDPEGSVTRTNTIKLIRQLDEEFKAVGKELRGAELLRAIQDRNPESDRIRRKLLGAVDPTLQDQVESLTHEELVAAFRKGKLRTREKTFIPLMQLVSPEGTFESDNNARILFEQTRQQLLTGAAAIKDLERRMAEREADLGTAALSAAEAGNRFAARVETDPHSGTVGQLAQDLQKIMDAAEVPATEQTAMKALLTGAGFVDENAVGQLRRQARAARGFEAELGQGGLLGSRVGIWTSINRMMAMAAMGPAAPVVFPSLPRPVLGEDLLQREEADPESARKRREGLNERQRKRSEALLDYANSLEAQIVAIEAEQEQERARQMMMTFGEPTTPQALGGNEVTPPTATPSLPRRSVSSEQDRLLQPLTGGGQQQPTPDQVSLLTEMRDTLASLLGFMTGTANDVRPVAVANAADLTSSEVKVTPDAAGLSQPGFRGIG